MTMRALILLTIASALAGAACTMDQTRVPELTGPSTFATSLTMSANPDTTALGQSSTQPGQQSLIIASVIDEKGQPKPNQTVRFETRVNGQLSNCGQLSRTTVVTGSDGRASVVFTAPSFPTVCSIFNTDGSVTVRATIVGTDFQSSSVSARDVGIFMALPTVVNPVGGFVVDFTVSQSAGVRNFSFNGSSSFSSGHTITSYAWTASDGWSESGRVVDHDFGASGTYVVTLTITDDIGQSGSKSFLLQVIS